MLTLWKTNNRNGRNQKRNKNHQLGKLLMTILMSQSEVQDLYMMFMKEVTLLFVSL
jgi:hypothetical protein